jgi:hypothetical protein
MSAEGIDAIDILKVDIEGMEFAVLPGAHCLTRAGQVIGELHPDFTDEDVSGFVEELAKGSGLTRVGGLPGHLFLLRQEGPWDQTTGHAGSGARTPDAVPRMEHF